MLNRALGLALCLAGLWPEMSTAAPVPAPFSAMVCDFETKSIGQYWGRLAPTERPNAIVRRWEGEWVSDSERFNAEAVWNTQDQSVSFKIYLRTKDGRRTESPITMEKFIRESLGSFFGTAHGQHRRSLRSNGLRRRPMSEFLRYFEANWFEDPFWPSDNLTAFNQYLLEREPPGGWSPGGPSQNSLIQAARSTRTGQLVSGPGGVGFTGRVVVIPSSVYPPYEGVTVQFHRPTRSLR